jgi:hypothetical protein
VSPRTSQTVTLDVPPEFHPYVEHARYSLGDSGADGVELKLTDAGVKYARGDGAQKLATWVMQQPLWKGHRTLLNVTQEISNHARFAHWPLISTRANPVDLEYYQSWPLSLLLAVPNRIRALMRRK